MSKDVPRFSPDELRVVEELPGVVPGLPGTPVYDFPISQKEAVRRMYEKNPAWEIISMVDLEFTQFNPRIIPDNVARAFVYDAEVVPGVDNTHGGKDMFGIDWEFIPTAGGSMVRPGKPYIESVEELRTKVQWPDIDSWDWEGSHKANEKYFDPNKAVVTWFFTGWFERLISFMDFEGAAMALIDEDEKEIVMEFFDKLTDMYIHLVDKMLETFPEIDVFFPYMKKLNDHIHAKGRFSHLHSCGHLMNQVENFIEAGWDAWDPQTMNDTYELYDKYGDKILVGIMLDQLFDPATASEEEQREAARRYVERFCDPEKPSMMSNYMMMQGYITPIFREELYIQSRQKYAG